MIIDEVLNVFNKVGLRVPKVAIDDIIFSKVKEVKKLNLTIANDRFKEEREREKSDALSWIVLKNYNH